MKRVITGLQPTGGLTLGNYIGAIKPMVELSNTGEYEMYLFIADLHALTVPQDRNELKERIRRFIAMYLACGIDPKKVTIYLQSENEFIPAISWILECNTYYGEASRMIQFKEKSKQHSNFSVGLLTYPTLMAADILFLDTDLVPVGKDQKQHVELARNIAERFNKTYGDTFVLPEPFISKTTAKIKDLKNPEKKMSKSEENPVGVISLFDDIEVINKKIMSATTDSEMSVKFDEENKPGISNLINIVVSLSDYSIEDIEKMFEGKNYGEFKKFVAEIVTNVVSDIKNKYNDIINSDLIDKVLDEGIEKVRAIAKAKYLDMCNKVGTVR